MTLDAHQHFWIYDPQRHAWIDEAMSRIRRNFLPEDLFPVLQANGIDGCIAVQADQNIEETDFLLDLAHKNEWIQAVVGWVDLKAPELASMLDTWSEEPNLVGFRHIVQAEPDPAFMLNPAFQQGLATLAKHGYSYDLLVLPHQLDQAIETVRRHPDVPFILDHLAKPNIKAQDTGTWKQNIRLLAQFPHVACKLSGMITEAHWQAWTYDDLLPVMEAVLEAFGSRRLLFGSDWPVCLVAGDYQEVVEVVRIFISQLSQDEQADIMGHNAQRWYGIGNE